jgi:hypothetical protein
VIGNLTYTHCLNLGILPSRSNTSCGPCCEQRRMCTLLMCIIDSPRNSNIRTAGSCLRFRTVGRTGWNHITLGSRAKILTPGLFAPPRALDTRPKTVTSFSALPTVVACNSTSAPLPRLYPLRRHREMTLDLGRPLVHSRLNRILINQDVWVIIFRLSKPRCGTKSAGFSPPTFLHLMTQKQGCLHQRI